MSDITKINLSGDASELARPETQLFLLSSVDGKITTGATDAFDFDQDLPKIAGVSEGLHSYYEQEAMTDAWSLNSGRVLAKVYRMRPNVTEQLDVTCVIIDSRHLGVEHAEWLMKKFTRVIIFTTRSDYPIKSGMYPSLDVIYQSFYDFPKIFSNLYINFGCTHLTVQTGSHLNAEFLRYKLIDHVNLVVAPIIVGGANTPSICGGEGIANTGWLHLLPVLRFVEVVPLGDSYLLLRYDVSR